MIVSGTQLNTYKEAGKISTQILSEIKESVKEGVFPIEIEDHAQKLCKKYGVKPSFSPVKNSDGPYGYALCLSVNQTVLHGIPSKKESFSSGDVVKLDFGIIHQGLHTDQCITVGVGSLSKKNRKLIIVTKDSVQTAVSLAVAGNTTGDLGSAMFRGARKNGFNVLKQYIGHGIGLQLHEHPPIPAYGTPGKGAQLKEGMVICIEAQVVAGKDQVYTADDGWSVITSDGKNSAMFEYMVVVGKDEPILLTDTFDWPIIVT